MKFNSLLFLFLLWITACQTSGGIDSLMDPVPEPIRILSLGDSYTIGQSVAENERFPGQLADSLQRGGLFTVEPKVIARTGWSTDQLIQAIEQEEDLGHDWDIVTLLIGVNNQFRGYPIARFQDEFQALLDRAIRFAGNRPERVFVLSIPDYAYTPFGQAFSDPQRISQEIDQYNDLKLQLTLQRGVRFTDITPISRMGLNRPELVAADRLHPSSLMYREWVELLLPEVRAELQ